MSDLRNNYKGYGLLNKPPISLYLYDYWWCNEPPTTLQKAKPKKKGVSNIPPQP